MSEAPHHLYRSQVDFCSNQNQQGSPETEFLQRPDRAMDLDFFNRRMTFDDRGEFEMWAFQTKKSGRVFPSPLVRLTEGEVFQATVKPSKKVHTIHWHGIEPDPRNDGAGTHPSRSRATTPTSGNLRSVSPAALTTERPAPTSTTATSTPRCMCRWGCSARWSSIPS